MKLYSENDSYKLYNGNMLDMLDVIEKESIDSIVTDPPYGLTSITKRFGKENSAECQYGKDGSFARLSKGFMGKEWDGSGIEYNIDTWKKCYEVLKEGGYLLAFGGSRTYHRIAVAIEDAGFEIRDTIMWIYGSGFPKSMALDKAIEGKLTLGNANTQIFRKLNGEMLDRGNYGYASVAERQGARPADYNEIDEQRLGKLEPTTELSKKYQGWGTALKPSFEPIIVARKPFKGSLVDNVIKNGVGGINIDECRVENNNNEKLTRKLYDNPSWKNSSKAGQGSINDVADKLGRFPANTILTYDETDFDEVCGGFPNTKSGGGIKAPTKNINIDNATNFQHSKKYENVKYIEDSGSASRYFMNCKYTGKDKEIWKQLLVNNVENNLEILKATKDNIVQMNVEDLLKELKDHYAKYVVNLQDLTETPIVQDIVEILTWDFKIETSQVMQDFIANYKKCIQFLNLVQFVEKMDNIDTTQITQNLLKLFGYVKVVITNYILGNVEYDQRRYIYTPKASKKDRDEGLEEIDEKPYAVSNQAIAELKRGNLENTENRSQMNSVQMRKNTHPTVKPTELMQYLVRLVTPNGGIVLDPFNGSGSTGKAVMYENKERNKNYKYIGIELTEEYLPIAQARIEYVCNQINNDKQTTIFDFLGDSNE